MKQPILFVSLNYRLAHFGFTASKEFADAGLLNLGFEDQRNAFRWIQQNIAKVKITAAVLYQVKHKLTSCSLVATLRK